MKSLSVHLSQCVVKITASPQIVAFGEFSTASDVWLVAMTMWDFAIQPYFGLFNEEVINHIHDGRIS